MSAATAGIIVLRNHDLFQGDHHLKPMPKPHTLSDEEIFDAMDLRLKRHWARWSRTGGGLRPDLWESDSRRPAIALTQDDIEDAITLHHMVMRLPAPHRLVLAVDYDAIDPAGDEDPNAEYREKWQEVNHRLGKLARACFEKIPLISRSEYGPIKQRAVRMVINAEAVLIAATMKGS